MSHVAEDSTRLSIVSSQSSDLAGFDEAVAVVLPPRDAGAPASQGSLAAKDAVCRLLAGLGTHATAVVIGEVCDLAILASSMPAGLRYQLWIAIKRATTIYAANMVALPEEHFGALVYTRYDAPLRHAKTRVAYTYCPACKKTSKDYGGKKHTYDPYGTLMSDVWRDIEADLNGDLSRVIERFADLLGHGAYSELRVVDLRDAAATRDSPASPGSYLAVLHDVGPSRITCGDAVVELRKLPSDSVDFAFADPPYNLAKAYAGYEDDLDVRDFFAWCDDWLGELTRVLRPGCTLAVLNTPNSSIRHFGYLRKRLLFQTWIVWDALSFPVRFVMPAHYSILCFTKAARGPFLDSCLVASQLGRSAPPPPFARSAIASAGVLAASPRAATKAVRSRISGRTYPASGIDHAASTTQLRCRRSSCTD